MVIPISLMYLTPFASDGTLLTMSASKRTNPNFTNGVPELVVLHLLAKREMYGYEIVKAIRETTDATLSFGEGAIYPVLHGLERDRLISSRSASVSGRTRYYYRLNRKGHQRLQAMTDDWTRTTGAVNTLLGALPDAIPAV